MGESASAGRYRLLAEEQIRVLKELQGGRRLRFANAQRCRLTAKAKTIRFGRLCAIGSIVRPQTLLRWHRQLVAKNYASSHTGKPGRPRRAEEIRRLVIQMAQANRM